MDGAIEVHQRAGFAEGCEPACASEGSALGSRSLSWGEGHGSRPRISCAAPPRRSTPETDTPQQHGRHPPHRRTGGDELWVVSTDPYAEDEFLA